MSDLAVLLAGDDFVLPELMDDALRQRLPGGVDTRHLRLPWPRVPFGPVAEVAEAAGTEDELIAALPGATVAVTHLAPFTDRVFAAAPDLRLVVVCRGGPVNVNLESATRHGVAVCYAPGRNANAVAEFTLGLMLATCRNIVTSRAAVDDGSWHGGYFDYRHAGREISGSTVGLVGYSAVGRLVARLLLAFGARVSAFDPYVDAADFDSGVRKVETLPRLLRDNQIVSLHQRLTPETRGMIGAPELAAMPRGSVLVNTARGGVLDYDALGDALRSGHLGAAGLDVFDEEPLPSHSGLLGLDNVVMTPHIAGCSTGVAELAARICAAEVTRWVGGEPFAHCANPEVLET